jgi:hypothetical protein
MSIKGKPDVSAFLDGGAATLPEVRTAPASKKAAKQQQAVAPSDEPKRKKLVELPVPIFEALKDRAYEEFKKSGRRVTETEIIIAALGQYLGVV